MSSTIRKKFPECNQRAKKRNKPEHYTPTLNLSIMLLREIPLYNSAGSTAPAARNTGAVINIPFSVKR